MNKQLLTLLLLLLTLFCHSQDTLTRKSESIGLSSIIFHNFSSIKLSSNDEKINPVKQNFLPGYSIGIGYLYRHNNLFLELVMNYIQENDNFIDFPRTTHYYTTSGTTYSIIEGLDYNNKMKFYLRYSAFSWLIKFGVQPLNTKCFSLGTGIGIAPCIINSEKIYNFKNDKYEDFYRVHDQAGIQCKAVGSLNFIYSPATKVIVKAAPTAMLSLIKKNFTQYTLRPFNLGIDIGLYYKFR